MVDDGGPVQRLRYISYVLLYVYCKSTEGEEVEYGLLLFLFPLLGVINNRKEEPVRSSSFFSSLSVVVGFVDASALHQVLPQSNTLYVAGWSAQYSIPALVDKP